MGLFDLLARTLGLKSKKTTYPYIIEIRPIVEKLWIKRVMRSFGRVDVPHITLVYNFRPKKNEIVIMKKIKETTNYIIKNVGMPKITYDGFEIKETNKGLVYVLKTVPSNEMMELRELIYQSIKNDICEDPNKEKYNEKIWLHTTILNHVKRKIQIKKIEEKKQPFAPNIEVLRISLVKNKKIRYEYDVLTNKILRRADALNKNEKKKTLKLLRKRNETKPLNYNEIKHQKSNVWLISDTHFYHKNIIGYCRRPFVDVYEMNNYIINEWNKWVKEKDVVYFLGDLVNSRNNKMTRHVLKRLNGHIKIIKGNHDRYGAPYDILKYRNTNFLLIHNPLDINKIGYIKFDWTIHGHKHNNDLRNYPFINTKNKTINVSIELTSYRPINIGELDIFIEKCNKNMYTINDAIKCINNKNNH